MRNQLSSPGRLKQTVMSNLPLIGVLSLFALAATKVINDAPRIVQEMHVGSPDFKRVHHEEAMRIKSGNMGPVDYAVRFMLGQERFKHEMKDAFKREEAMAEIPVTDADLATVEENY